MSDHPAPADPFGLNEEDLAYTMQQEEPANTATQYICTAFWNELSQSVRLDTAAGHYDIHRDMFSDGAIPNVVRELVLQNVPADQIPTIDVQIQSIIDTFIVDLHQQPPVPIELPVKSQSTCKWMLPSNKDVAKGLPIPASHNHTQVLDVRGCACPALRPRPTSPYDRPPALAVCNFEQTDFSSCSQYAPEGFELLESYEFDGVADRLCIGLVRRSNNQASFVVVKTDTGSNRPTFDQVPEFELELLCSKDSTPEELLEDARTFVKHCFMLAGVELHADVPMQPQSFRTSFFASLAS